MKTILITGAAGFIGWKTSELLLKKNTRVIGIDNLNDYYDVRFKKYRLNLLRRYPEFSFYKVDIENASALKKLFKNYRFDAVINLAARAGVRASIDNPRVYATTNFLGTLNLLELCRYFKVNKFVLSSTSSLYAGEDTPFKETLAVNKPISPYAATKKGAEALCYTYHYLYGIDITILRYFTVYGPAGRPDMSVFRFIKNIDEGRPIEVYGDGGQKRDFTYIDDIADGTIKSLKKLGFKIINLGGNNPHRLSELIHLIEKSLGKKAKIKYLPCHKADMKTTWANVKTARRLIRWKAKVPFQAGIRRTVEWHKKSEQIG